jgi:hypothetical protein
MTHFPLEGSYITDERTLASDVVVSQGPLAQSAAGGLNGGESERSNVVDATDGSRHTSAT